MRGRSLEISIFKTYLNARMLSCLREPICTLKSLSSTQRDIQVLVRICFLHLRPRILGQKVGALPRPILYSSGLLPNVALCCLTSKILETIYLNLYFFHATPALSTPSLLEAGIPVLKFKFTRCWYPLRK